MWLDSLKRKKKRLHPAVIINAEIALIRGLLSIDFPHRNSANTSRVEEQQKKNAEPINSPTNTATSVRLKRKKKILQHFSTYTDKKHREKLNKNKVLMCMCRHLTLLSVNAQACIVINNTWAREKVNLECMTEWDAKRRCAIEERQEKNKGECEKKRTF